MPRLSELLKRPVNNDGSEKQWSHSAPLSTLQPRGDNLPTDPSAPVLNVNLRCPMPAIGNVNADSLRQFYKNGTAQFRVFTEK